MKRIFKYKLEVEGAQHIEMPERADILCVQVQNGEPHIWARVDPAAPKEKVFFRTYGTGHEMEKSWKRYVGTYQLEGGALVFHVFTD